MAEDRQTVASDDEESGGVDADGGAVSIAKTVVGEISARNVPFMASSIAYQAFVSLIPLLVLVFFLVSAVGDEALAERVTATTEGMLPESGQELLEDAIAGSVATTGASVIGLVTLLWGSLKIFRGLDTAFSEIYDTTGESSFVESLRDAAIVFGAIGLALLAAAVASAAFAFLPDSTLLAIANPLLLVVGFTLAFYPMYYYFPDVSVSRREVLPGVVVAAVGWAALQALFQVYVSFASGSGSGGAVGAILLLLTWLYFGGLVLLVGAVVNAVVAGRIPAAGPDEDETASKSVVAGVTDRAAPDAVARERGRLEERIEDLDRERSLLEDDLRAQRRRRFLLEDRTDRLEERVSELTRENERLSRENERLRARLDRRRDPGWKRGARRLLDRTTELSVGTVRERE